MPDYFGYFNKAFANKNDTASEKYIRFFVFIFPIAGISVRHWYSVIFGLIAIFSIYQLKNIIHVKYSREEKIIFFSLFLFFVSYLISVFMHGWFDAVGVEIRFLFAISIYALIIKIDDIHIYLAKGSIIAAFLISCQVLYEMITGDMNRANGIYGPLLLGPVSVLMLFIAVSSLPLLKNKIWRFLVYFSFPISILSMIASASRSAYMGFLIISIYMVMVYLKKPIHKILFLVALTFFIFFLYFSFQKFRVSVDQMFSSMSRIEKIEEAKTIDVENPLDKTVDSGFDRYVVWKTAFEIIKNNIIFGIGYNKYSETAQRYINEGMVPNINPAVLKRYVHQENIIHGHTHNIFLEILILKGVVGLMFFMVFIFTIFRIHLKKYKFNYAVSRTGIGVLILILVFGMFEAAPINKGNFSAIFILYTMVFLSRHHDSAPSTQDKV